MIHVCFALYDKTGCYSKFTGTTMCSIFENAPSLPHSITIHILHDNTLTNDNRDKFIYLTGRYNQIIKFYNVEKLCLEKIVVIKNVLHKAFKERFSVAAMYRFLIPYLLSADTDKVIYLDSDIVVNLDINKLWLVELYDKPLGAIPNVFQGSDKQAIIEHTKRIVAFCNDNIIDVEYYFNSGVLLMNMKAMLAEENNIMSSINFISKNPQYTNFDQDALNYAFSKKYLRLPIEFNQYVKYARSNNENIEEKIYHYAGTIEGLGFNIDDPFNRLWMDYFTKTPWFGVSTIGNLYKSIDEFGEARRNLLITFSATISGKTRVFVIDDKKATDWLKRTYFVRDDEEIFIYEDEHSLQNLIDEMNISHGKKIFFIRVNNQLIESLKKAGFIEGKDFFNHYVLFMPQLLKKNDSYSLILAM